MKKRKRLFAFLLTAVMVFSLIASMPLFVSASALPIDPEDYEGLVISKVYANGGDADGVCKYSFIELYNASDYAICLEGLALYYKKLDDTEYNTLDFPDDVIPAGGSYLVRCKKAKDYLEENQIIEIKKYDIEWDVKLNKKETSIVLAAAGCTLDVAKQVAELDDTISYFCGTQTFYFDSGYLIDDISKNKVAVRCALKADSGWASYNLTSCSSEKLKQILPMYSGGVAAKISQYPLNEVFFSNAAGFYENAFDLTLSAAEGYTIYYTTDGSDPITSASRIAYDAPITLADTTHKGYGATTLQTASVLGNSILPTVSNLIGGHVIKAYATKEDATPEEIANAMYPDTEVYTASYFVSSEMQDYGVDVVSISMDKDLFAGENGFYNNYFASTNDSNLAQIGLVEIFDENGVRRGYSSAELSISGHGSSGWGMKSIKLKVSKKTGNGVGGKETKINYDLFDGTATNCKGQAITTFGKLVLRNAGNDHTFAGLRDAFMQRVSGELDIDTTASAPALVFVNGEFWGYYNIRERYCQDYVEAHYGVLSDNVATLETDFENLQQDLNAPLMVNDGEQIQADNFNALVAFMKNNSLANSTNYDYVESQIDIASFIDMYVAHLYFNAADWPQNNIKIWRNTTAEDQSGMDTKWHFTLHDMDMGADYVHEGNNIASISTNNFNSWINGEYCPISNMMRALIQNQSFKTQFLARFYEVTKYGYNTTEMMNELNEMVDERIPLMPLQAGRWSQSSGQTVAVFNTEVNKIREYVRTREDFAISQCCSFFGVSENGLRTLSTYSNTSFRGASVDCFYVNGVQQNPNSPYINGTAWIENNIPGRVLDCTNVSSIGFRGWMGFDGVLQNIGYQINNDAPVFGYTASTAEAAVLSEYNGGANAKRFQITIPLDGLTGVNSVCVVALVDGQVIRLDGQHDTRSNMSMICNCSGFQYKQLTDCGQITLADETVGEGQNAAVVLENCEGQAIVANGWHANNAGIYSIGYRVDGGDAVFNAVTGLNPGNAAKAEAAAEIGNNAVVSALKVTVPVVRGEHTVEILCDSGSAQNVLWTFTYSDTEIAIDPNAPVITLVTNGNEITVTGTLGDNTGMIVAPEYTGIRFVGWFEDETFTTPADLSNVEGPITIYGKYVHWNYFCLASVDAVTGGKLSRVRVITAMDSKKYHEYGFEITIGNGEKKVYPALSTYTSVSGGRANRIFGSPLTKTDPMFYRDITVSGLADGTEILVVPYYVTMDGTRVLGYETTIICHASRTEYKK